MRREDGGTDHGAGDCVAGVELGEFANYRAGGVSKV